MREAAAYLVKAFREAGHVADHAADGLEGYAMAEASAYDVLVVDRMLPRARWPLPDPLAARAEASRRRS